jgi:hypothetical protein
LIPISTLLHPFADKPFRILGVIDVRCIYKVTAEREINVEEFVRIFIFAKNLAP